MSQQQCSRRFVLASRPDGEPRAENFRLETVTIPQPTIGQLLLRTIYLSLDPYMRGRMSDAPSYAPPLQLGQVMIGSSVSRVQSSQHPDFKPGDWVLGNFGWQEYALSDGIGLRNLGERLENPTHLLGILGMPGFTAYMGLLDIGKPQDGETVVVAAASGAVGSIVGQIAKLKGCRVIGVAGGVKKCRYVMDELGFDACIDHQAANFATQLALACPQGIDIYFENVGGLVFDAVIPLLNTKARIPVCGVISQYNATSLPNGPDRLPLLQSLILRKRIKMQGFIIFDDYATHFTEFSKQMDEWVTQGKVKLLEDVVDGLENAPQAFLGLLQGKNFGKLIIRVAKE
ncbi:NADP-dependent oxidoreductase [Serratia sp. UGAL515B_01]|uniref:NADP-dependent oxidoreductase n=1 Tax=Serratia sp. UGAL515B_01 TaxID=2986763 RepID=UPI002952E76D|nr:NADP-dependent oxidoreductase [Serratia sp. UGAL515B_01]WON78520.1 NADP-dependent oxidoreductase [Serratia sp. UGAL515B_01]